MRVAIVAETYLPYLSGVTVSTEALARGLGERGHRVLLIAPRPARGAEPGSAGARGPEPEYGWLPSYQLPRPVPPGYRMPWPLPGARAMRRAVEFRPQVVHAQSPFVAGMLARGLARRAGAPLVFTHHTRFADYRHYLGALAGPGAAATDAFLRRFWTGCAAIIAPSSDLAAEFEARLAGRPRPIVRAIPTGVDVERMARLAAVDPRPAHGWPSDAVVAVSLGRLAPEKSVETLLEAVSLAAARAPRLRLLLIGDGPSGAALRRRAVRPDLAGRVGFAGHLPRLEALAAAKGGDLFLFASQTETQGLVLAEALACGLPALAVDGPGVRDSVTDSVDGMLVAARPARAQAAALADRIVALAADADRRAEMAAAALRGAARFDVAVRLAAVEQVYQLVRER